MVCTGGGDVDGMCKYTGIHVRCVMRVYAHREGDWCYGRAYERLPE